ncbi:MAG: UDP-N-acetylglucosamine--N-acetylmuramyl-(pentapeptide) pyrophosphoryl-undecaprenol N-acetylglucosamine transferase [Actinobacteria bacterium]|nr:UDP-N-acetylglucosamine--N-acetylmuramyl-(pentapeptide) pyrophosphoryl-undecaprenol N-acetylglucosamine transferase [Actinomycetota bacterium]
MSALSGKTALLAAGGTGGHLQPALAVAAEARARGARVVVVTTPSQVERVAARYQTFALELKGFSRGLAPRDHLTTLRLLAAAVPGVGRILKEVRPDVAVGGGGFASGPVVALAALRGIPGLALEADAHLGVANRLLRPFVRRVCLSFPIAGLEPPKYVLTGRPLGPAQLAATAEEGREVFALRADLPVVLAFGGSQGAQSINRACIDAFGGRELDVQIVHVCGPRNIDAVRAELAAKGERFEHYRLVPYTDRLAAAMAAADLAVARSGGSVAELAALGKPAILVPYPYATADHQRKNARWMVAGGAALLVDDAELGGDLLGRLVADLLGDPGRLAAMTAASAALGRPHATAKVVDEIEKIMKR